MLRRLLSILIIAACGLATLPAVAGGPGGQTVGAPQFFLRPSPSAAPGMIRGINDGNNFRTGFANGIIYPDGGAGDGGGWPSTANLAYYFRLLTTSESFQPDINNAFGTSIGNQAAVTANIAALQRIVAFNT